MNYTYSYYHYVRVLYSPITQWLEYLTHNEKVVGSSPTRATSLSNMDYIKPMKFVPECYESSDKLGKDILRNFLLKRGWTILKDTEDGNHDIVAEKDGVTSYFEVELKNKYKFTDKESFKFTTVSFLGRKRRLHLKHPFNYVIICSETGYAITLHSNEIFCEEYVEKLKINTERRKGEDTFFRVPKDLCTFFKIK